MTLKTWHHRTLTTTHTQTLHIHRRESVRQTFSYLVLRLLWCRPIKYAMRTMTISPARQAPTTIGTNMFISSSLQRPPTHAKLTMHGGFVTGVLSTASGHQEMSICICDLHISIFCILVKKIIFFIFKVHSHRPRITIWNPRLLYTWEIASTEAELFIHPAK